MWYEFRCTCRRDALKPRIFGRGTEVAGGSRSVQRMVVEAGRPVLIGTRSVKASEEISAVLAGRGIEHALLNAKQDNLRRSLRSRDNRPG